MSAFNSVEILGELLIPFAGGFPLPEILFEDTFFVPKHAV
jgi:hypothetical protein